MQDDSRPSAPDFTVAALVMMAVNLTWILVVIWLLWGAVAALALALALNHAIERMARRRGAVPLLGWLLQPAN